MRRPAWAAVALTMAVVGPACGDDDGGGSDAVADLVASLDESGAGFADLVAQVADDGLSPGDARTVATALPDHLDEVVESTQGDGPITWPDTVALFEALADDPTAAATTVEAVATWIVARAEPLVGADPTGSEVEQALLPAADVVAAARDGFEEADGDVSETELETGITQAARTELSALVAAAAGEPPPEPGRQAELLSDAFESGDPIELVDSNATRAAEALDADDPW